MSKQIIFFPDASSGKAGWRPSIQILQTARSKPGMLNFDGTLLDYYVRLCAILNTRDRLDHITWDVQHRE
jgi:hypothetical protein